MLTADTKQLKKQINDLLNSNINEDSKTGLHHLLGDILDKLLDCKKCIIEERRI